MNKLTIPTYIIQFIQKKRGVSFYKNPEDDSPIMSVQKFDRKPGQSDDMFKRYYGQEEELTLKVGSKYIIS
jgi:hypothetical protein